MIDKLTAAPRRLTLGGEVYEVHPLTLADLGKLQSWLDSQLPDPMAAAQRHIDAVKPTMEVQKYLYRTALEQAGRTRIFLGTPEAAQYLNSIDGVIELLYLGVSKGRPAFTRDDAREVFSRMTPADVLRLQQGTELDQVQDQPDPKAATA
jgi:hypothetical protein